MAREPITYSKASEVAVVGLARSGDREAFAELVRRRQSWIRNLMRRFCHDDHLADELDEASRVTEPPGGAALDLDRALASLPDAVRLCIVLSYNEGMTHEEIAETTDLRPGTVKSHIRRGSERLRHMLADYRNGMKTHDR